MVDFTLLFSCWTGKVSIAVFLIVCYQMEVCKKYFLGCLPDTNQDVFDNMTNDNRRLRSLV